MVVARNRVVSIHFSLANSEGRPLDSTAGGEPLTFIYGLGYTLPGLEKLLKGRKAGSKVDAVIPAAQAFGERRDDRIMQVPRSRLPAEIEVRPGLQYVTRVETPPWYAPFFIQTVQGDTLTLDLNHPLAGEDLQVHLEVIDVRDPTAEELNQAKELLKALRGDA